MSPEHWKRVKQVVNGALDREPERLASYLDEACGDDRELRKEVEGVLGDIANPDSFLKDPFVNRDRLSALAALKESTKSHNATTIAAVALPDPYEFHPGQCLAERYVIVQFIARGGMGEVYEAMDQHLQGKHIAIKTLRPEIAADPDMRASFEREVLLAREVAHRAVCPTYDLIRVDSNERQLLCLTMKLLRGEALSARLRRSGPMDPETALPIVRQMAAGLEAAHQAGVIHRDFKPGNVMLEGQGSLACAVITDFGLSRTLSGDCTLRSIGQIAGTPAYMAPELFAGRLASPASDIYAFGMVLHEMLTCRHPLDSGRGPDLSRLPAPDSWKRAIEGCLLADPRERFQAIGEVMDTLDNTGALRPRLASAHKPIGRRTITAILVAAALAIALALVWVVPVAQRLLHPLPQRRFVALTAGTESGAQQAPLLHALLGGMHDRLVRAESHVSEFLVIGSEELAPQRENVSAMGANLELQVTLSPPGNFAHLQLTDLQTSTILRTADVHVGGNRAEAAHSVAAASAAMLEIPSVPVRLRDEDESAALPAKVYQLFTAAEELRRQPNDAGLDAAIEDYQRVLEMAPHFAFGYARIALAYVRKYHNSHDAAALEVAGRNAELAVRYNPESPGALLAQASFYTYSGRSAEAFTALSNVLRLDPDNPEVYIYQATAYRDQNRSSDEEKTCRALIRQRPNYYRAYNALGMALYRQGRSLDSIAAFEQATQIAPREALPFTNLGLAYMLAERKKEASAAFYASLERAPEELAWLNLGNLSFQDRDYRTALQQFEKARDIKPSDDLAWRNIADCYAVLNDRKAMLENYAQAAQLLKKSLRTNSIRGSSWMTMAFYQAKLSHIGEAQSALQSAEKAGASTVPAQFTKAQTLAVLNDRPGAIRVLCECVRRGLSPVEIVLALDLKSIREDPQWIKLSASCAPAKERGQSK